MDELNEPYISEELIEYLKEVFDINYLLSITEDKDSDFSMGFIRGTLYIINHLDVLREEQEERQKE